MYSQNAEEKHILNFFADKKVGVFLSIGENDGITLSNSRALAERGWHGVCIEPDYIAYGKLELLYKDNKNVHTFNCAIGNKTRIDRFWSSGTHLKKGDTGLLSTGKKKEVSRSHEEEFTEGIANFMRWDDFLKTCPIKQFDFITVDAEGYDLDILKQMDLSALDPSMVIVEWNSIPSNKEAFDKIMKGWHILHVNGENIIYTR
jgi:FkbM family methyltransferase